VTKKIKHAHLRYVDLRWLEIYV